MTTKETTPQQRIALLKHLAGGKPPETVATILNLTRDQVVDVARHHGYPDSDKMSWAVDILVKKQLEGEQAALPAGTPQRLDLSVVGPSAKATAPLPTKPDEIRVLLNAAKGHPSKRIQAAADRVFDQLDKLRGLIREDEEKNSAKRRAAAEREARRLAEQRKKEALRAEVARLEAELKAKKAQLRGKPTTSSTAAVPGAGTNEVPAKVIRAWASENQIDCPASGRVPTHIRQAYDDAHQDGAA